MPEVRLIDGDALINELDKMISSALLTDTQIHYALVRELVAQQPTIEPEVRHGRWILCEDQHGVDNDNNNYAYFCSQCHYQDVHSKYAKVNFCWNCGADMREGGADNG